MTESIRYAREENLGAEDFIDVLKRSTLAERRPVDERARIEKMLRNTNLIVTARTSDGKLVGVARCLTDFAFSCFCSDLAVDAAYQKRGIGERLLEEAAKAASEYAHFILLSAPKARGFYERIGMVRHPDAFERTQWKRFADGRTI